MYKSKYCKVSYIQEKNAILCKWLEKCSGENYKAPLKYALELLQKRNATMWITDTTNGFKNEVEESKWLVEEFIPKTIESSCKKVVFVISKTSPLKEEIDEQSKALSEYFEVLQMDNLSSLEKYGENK